MHGSSHTCDSYDTSGRKRSTESKVSLVPCQIRRNPIHFVVILHGLAWAVVVGYFVSITLAGYA